MSNPLATFITKLTTSDYPDLLQRAKIPDPACTALKKLLAFLEPLQNLTFCYHPNLLIDYDELIADCHRLLDLLHNIHTQTATGPPYSDSVRNRMSTEIQQYALSIPPGFIPLLGSAALERFDTTADIGKAVADVKARGETLIGHYQRELAAHMHAFQELSENSALTKHATAFNTQAKHHRNAAYIWLAVTVMSFAAITIVAWLLLKDIIFHALPTQPTIQTSSIIPPILARVAILSLGYFFVIWCARSYRSHQHNYVVNQHRRNALQSFNAFARATDDAQARHALLAEAAKCVYSAQPSGYFTKGTSPSAPPINQVLGLLNKTES
jgi:hypothetical protein